jgi:hypothetical protein
VLGISSLAKPHAFFVVPALVIFIFLSARAMNSKYLGIAASRIVVFGTSLVGTKFILGYLIGGERSLSIFGRYGSVQAATDRATSTLVQNSGLDALTTSWGQTMMIVMILGVGLPVAILGLLSSFSRNRDVFQANRARSLIAISLLNMMAVTALFEAWQNLSFWMHTRYYSYLIPLFLIVLIEAYIHSELKANSKVKIGVVATFLVLGVVALITAGLPYGTNWIDAPDFRAHVDNLVPSSIFILISLGLALTWLKETRKVMLVALAIALASFLLSGTYISNFLQASFGQSSNYDHLGRVLRDYLPQEELDRSVLIGDNNTNMERALFTALTGGAKAILAPPEGFDVNQLPEDVLWVVKVGNPEITGLVQPFLTGNDFSIHLIGPPTKSGTPRTNKVLSITDKCSASNLTEWACGNETLVTYQTDGAETSAIDLVLELSESASQSELEFVIGRTVIRGTVPVGLSAFSLQFPRQETTGELIIRVPADSSISLDENQKFVRVVSANLPRS